MPPWRVFPTEDGWVYARVISLRHDWGPQYRSDHFTGSIRWLGIDDSPAFVGEAQTHGCAERFIRTRKEQCLWARSPHPKPESPR